MYASINEEALPNQKILNSDCLESANTLFHMATDAAPCAIAVVAGIDMRIKRANPAFATFIGDGITQQSVCGIPLSRLLPDYVENGLDTIFKQVADTRMAFSDSEYRYTSREKGTAYWHWSVIALPAPPDAAPDLLFQATDITEKVLARRKSPMHADWCKQQHNLFETALAAIPDCNYIFDLHGRIVFANRALADLLEKPTHEIIGKRLLELTPSKDIAAKLQHQVQEVIRSASELRDEAQFISRSGRLSVVECIVVPVFGIDGQVEAVAGSTRDVTERKMAEWALQAAHDDLERKVLERTAELVKANSLLKSENTVRLLAEESLLRSKHFLHQLAAHQESIKEDERKRIAREIHDELGQQLLVLRMDVSMLHTRTKDRYPRLHQKVDTALRNIDNTIHSIRSIINNLRPAVLDLGLYAAIEWQVRRFEEHTGIACDLISDCKEITLQDSFTTALFRTVQESLTNVSRHSKATQVLIELYARNSKLFMKVSDNGVGVKSGTRRKKASFGLLGIRERITTLGGEIEIQSEPDHGMTLTVSVPLQASMLTH